MFHLMLVLPFLAFWGVVAFLAYRILRFLYCEIKERWNKK